MAPRREPKEVKEPVTAVDKTFYELTIQDLNNKLGHLRSHTEKMELRNEEIEAQIKQLEEDRSDVTAYLDRTLQTKICSIKDLEEKLSELAKVRSEETTEFRRLIKEGELKYKTMQDELTSEIKLLTGKLNSLEEFRIQKDELLAKFDQQESELRVQTKNHRDLIYDIERKQVLDKDRLKTDVENKLLQLSTEFAKSNEIRISAHVQRLVRENIALNNELDRMMFSQRRIQSENKQLISQDEELRGTISVVANEKASLVKTCDLRLEVIKQLTTKYEELCEKNAKLVAADHNRVVKENRAQMANKNMQNYEQKVHMLEQHVHAIRTECQSHQMIVKQQAAELQRLYQILKKLKFTVRSAAETDPRTSDDAMFRATQRKYLLDELLSILLDVKEGPVETVSSFETVASVQELYRLGDIGISPQYSLNSLLNLGRPLNRVHRSRQSAAQQNALDVDDNESITPPKVYESWPIIELESGSSVLLISDSSKGAVAGPNEAEEDQLEDEDLGASSSDEGDVPKSASAPVDKNSLSKEAAADEPKPA